MRRQSPPKRLLPPRNWNAISRWKNGVKTPSLKHGLKMCARNWKRSSAGSNYWTKEDYCERPGDTVSGAASACTGWPSCWPVVPLWFTTGAPTGASAGAGAGIGATLLTGTGAAGGFAWVTGAMALAGFLELWLVFFLGTTTAGASSSSNFSYSEWGKASLP